MAASTTGTATNMRLLLIQWGVLTACGVILAIEVIATGNVVAGHLLWVLAAGGLALARFTYLFSKGSATRLLDPLVAPLLYLVYALVIPLLYISLTDNGIQYFPASILNTATVAVSALFVLGYALGASSWNFRRRVVAGDAGLGNLPTNSSGTGSPELIRDGGRLILLIALAAKLYQWVADGSVLTQAYGANQLVYDESAIIATLGEALVAVGSLLVMRGNVAIVGKPLLVADWVILAAVSSVSMFVLGGRAEVIAPIILYLWFRLQSGNMMRVGQLILGLSAIAGLFLLVAVLRTRGAPGREFPLIERLLVETSSPVYLTSNVAGLVPSWVDYYWGDTYLQSLKLMMPGPIARAIFGGVEGTGALVYRQLTGFADPNQGWGFSLPTEAYLNYGYVGVLVIGVVFGILMRFSYARAQGAAGLYALSPMIYPLLVSYLPYGLRSDFLGQMKSTVYPLVIFALVLLIARSMPHSDLTGARGASRIGER